MLPVGNMSIASDHQDEPGLYMEVLHKAGNWLEILPEYEELCGRACKVAIVNTHIMREVPWVEVAITLTDNAEMQALNNQYLDKNAPTNVLSFPQHKWDPYDFAAIDLDRDKPCMLGDILLSAETVVQEAEAQGKSVQQHVEHLVVHGTLHLLGYDHVQKEDAAQMEELEITILEKLGVSNPYI